MTDFELLDLAISAYKQSAEEVIRIYSQKTSHTETKDDARKSPITEADTASHRSIYAILEASNIPIVSEEGSQKQQQQDREKERSPKEYWLIDPLDGTKEFIHRREEFAVHIALIRGDKPHLSIVGFPALTRIYFAIRNQGSYEFNYEDLSDLDFNFEDDLFTDKLKRLQIGDEANGASKLASIAVSRSHLDQDTLDLVEKNFINYELKKLGSSLKFILIADNQIDFYPRLAPTMIWDTAAPQLILEEAGGKVVNFEDGQDLSYNLAQPTNPSFVAIKSQKIWENLEKIKNN